MKSLWCSGFVLGKATIRPPRWLPHTCLKGGKWSKCKLNSQPVWRWRSHWAPAAWVVLAIFNYAHTQTYRTSCDCCLKSYPFVQFLYVKCIFWSPFSVLYVHTKSRVTVQPALPGPQEVLEEWRILLQGTCYSIPAKVKVYFSTLTPLGVFFIPLCLQ